MDQGSSRRWEIGDVVVTQIVELEMAVSPRFLLTGSDPVSIGALGWLAPHYIDGQGKLLSAIQAFVVDDGRNKIIVDTCVGNDKQRAMAVWSELDGPFLENLAAAGYPAETITHVVCTHLHLDHVGWNTRRDGERWVPTFPNARYIIAEQEWEAWQAADGDERTVIDDSVAPLFEAGRVELLDWNAPVTSKIRLAATPGHTLGHCSVLIGGGGRDVIVTGDVMHHPVQIVYPDWGSPADADAAMARSTRNRIVAEAEAGGTLLFGSHFSRRPCGCVRVDQGRRCFAAIEPDHETVLDRRAPKSVS